MNPDQEHEGVGYGRPPKHTQFKPGQSGNKTGRPRGIKSFRAFLNSEICATMSITENGERKTITKGRAIAKKLVNMAVTGNLAATSFIAEHSDLLKDKVQSVSALDYNPNHLQDPLTPEDAERIYRETVENAPAAE